MSAIKQQAGMGIALALVTAMSWGSLPIAMKVVLQVMDPFTVVFYRCLLYTSPSPRDRTRSRMPSSA